MKRPIKFLIQAVGVIALSFIFGGIIVVGVPYLFFSNAPSCQEDSEAVSYARSLSQQRLKKLYYDMEEYSHKEHTPVGGYYPNGKDTVIPEPFRDLKVVRIRPKEGNIMVQGCFDHYIYLTFKGIRFSNEIVEKRQIVLNWGENPPHTGTQVLWSE